MIYPTFTEAYISHLTAVYAGGTDILSRGLRCRELVFQNWTLTDVDACHIDWSKTGFPERQATYDNYAQKELSWYLTGDRRASAAPSTFWNTIADENGLVNSNYGHLILKWRRYPGQLTAYEHVLDRLLIDHGSRQAVMHYNLPSHFKNFCKDIPCTLTAQVWIRKGMLSMAVTQRSSDLWFGMPYDVPWHCYLIKSLARDLGVKPGFFHHSVGSLHIYARDFERVERTLNVRTTPTV